MATKALLVRLEATSGKEGAVVEEFLLSALPALSSSRELRHATMVRGSGLRDVDRSALSTRSRTRRHARRILAGPSEGPRGESRRALRLATDISNLDVIANKAWTPLWLRVRDSDLCRSAHARASAIAVRLTRQQASIWFFFGLWARCVRRVWD